ncbi:MAG: hypothetical protein ABI883_00855 [Chthoniobacterales bacterium]
MPSSLPFLASRRYFGRSLLALGAFVVAGCGTDNEEESSQSRPWDFRYEYGHTILFTYGGDGERHFVRGWSAIEPSHTWTMAPVASLGFRLRPCDAPVTFRMTMGAMIHPPSLPFQAVDVYAEEEKIATWQVAEFKTYTALIPRRFTSGPERRVIIRFDIPGAVSPAALGIGTDLRELGLMVTEVSLVKAQTAPPDAASKYVYGTKVSFGTRGNSLPYCLKGWSLPDGESTWTDAPAASLGFTLPYSEDPVVFFLRAGGMHGQPRIPYRTPSVSSQSVQVSVAEQKIAQWVVGEEGLFSAVIPQPLVSAPLNSIVIDLSLPDATSPAELGHNEDGRKLGLRVFSAAIVVQPKVLRAKRRPGGEGP